MNDILLSYARDLNDAVSGYEFSLWSKEQLLEYFNEAVCLISAHRPDLFTELKVIKVEPCHSYLNTCDCIKVLDVLGQCTKDGRIIKTLPRRVANKSVWTGAKRVKALATELSGYEIIDNTLVRVYPDNFDPTVDIYVLVRCTVEAKHYTLDSDPPDFRCAFMPVARHWVLYNAKMVDGEFSQTMHTSAREHRDMFASILGLIENADDKIQTHSNPRSQATTSH